MKPTRLQKTMAAAAIVVAPLAFILPGSSLAKHDAACNVGAAPYPTIQSAVDDTGCMAVEVPKGTFYEHVNICRDIVIRGAGSHNTVVDGSHNTGSVFTICAQPLAASHTVTLARMTITGGSNFNQPFPNGGAVSSADVALTVDDCRITNNEAGGRGGGLSVIRGSITIYDTIIANNRATDGGGVRMESTGVSSLSGTSSLTITNSVIADNTATRWGGGIVIVGGSLQNVGGVPATLTIRKSTVETNAAVAGGGIYMDNATLTIEDADIVGNTPDNLATRHVAP